MVKLWEKPDSTKWIVSDTIVSICCSEQ